MSMFICPQENLRTSNHCVLKWLIPMLVRMSLPALVMSDLAIAEEVMFDDTFLPEGSRSLDLTPYQQGNPVLPGDYRADIAVNGRLVSRQDIHIQADLDGSNARVCVNRPMLELIGVDLSKLSKTAELSLQSGKSCLSLPDLIEDSWATFSPQTQQLDISIPQATLRRNARGHVSPELWDRGVTAAMLGYHINANHNQFETGRYDSAYMGLNAGLNLGDWRLRHNGSLSWNSLYGQDYQVINTFAQRDITALKSQLTVGEANTSGEIFDTIAFRGLQLGSDDRMLPESLRSYAPVIRGVARTPARVEVRQAGNLLLETTVAPGAFVLDDLYPTGFGGDLEVTVIEADGSEQRFTVPFASTAQLLRPGTMRFSLTGGETRNNFVSQQAQMLQGSVQYGLNNMFTGYAGLQGSEDYSAVLGGLAFSTPLGAMAVDLTHAQTELASGREQGQSLRLSYSKNITGTGSNFAVAAHRFSTRGYLDFNNAIQLLDADHNGADLNQFGRPRSRLTLTANQLLGEFGQIAFSGFTQNYWNLPGNDLQYQLNYNKQYRHMNFGVSAARSRMFSGDMENNLLFTLSMPLTWGSSQSRPQLEARLGRDSDGIVSQQATLSGSAGENRQYSYGISAGHSDASNDITTALNGQYIGSQVLVSSTLSQGSGYESLSLGLSGSAIVHPGGVTLTPYRGETMAIVGAPGAEGAKVVGFPGLALDGRGYAVVPYLRPYQLNEVAIDPVGTSLDVELKETSQQVAPRAGAIAFLQYGTRSGQAILLHTLQEDGSPVPFAATVNDAEGASVGLIGQGGQLYARVKEGTRELWVSWGQLPEQRCVLSIELEQRIDPAAQRIESVCRPSLSAAPTKTDKEAT